MSNLGTQKKQPNDVLDYDVDFSEWLTGGDTIYSQVSTLDIDGELLIDTSAILIGGLVVKNILSGGVSGKKYKVTILMISVEGLRKEVEFYVKVKET